MTIQTTNLLLVGLAIAAILTGLVVVPAMMEHQQQAFAQGKSPGYGRFNNPGIEHRPCTLC